MTSPDFLNLQILPDKAAFCKDRILKEKSKCVLNTVWPSWEEKPAGIAHVDGARRQRVSRGRRPWAPGSLGTRAARLGHGRRPAGSLPGNQGKSWDHPASDLVCLSIDFYHIGHMLCLQGYKTRSYSRRLDKSHLDIKSM